ncbi:hypothetical protein [Streptacidiphilus jiangxiensis]|uniref:Uncharacterized protein n=1 Tax=Streptacidiphilus jiangxiensis TaxID=235985 RepID=A0A1H7VGM4_STRJI|nr:hypothetical protein [Streptacidiphilus jiangxiensis]SEM08422.1 hypothetical protein SAMN05414137_11832 [Streptacidiphilus jiangxiensis]
MSENTTTIERIHADHTVAKRLGNWTDAGVVEIRARRATVVVDLRSPHLPAEVEVRIENAKALVKLLVPEDTEVEHWDLRWSGKGSLKDAQVARDDVQTAPSRRIRVVGTAQDGEIRVHRGGVAMLSAMFSREYLEDLRSARKEGRLPIVDDPTRDSRKS